MSVFWRDSHLVLGQPVGQVGAGQVGAGLVSAPGRPCLPWGVLSEQSLSVVLPSQLFPGRQPVRKLLEMLQEWLASLPLDRIPYDAMVVSHIVADEDQEEGCHMHCRLCGSTHGLSPLDSVALFPSYDKYVWILPNAY